MMRGAPQNRDRSLRVADVRLLGSGEVVDIVVSEGTITAIEPSASATERPGSSRIALPGLVDLHTHLREPGGEVSETIATGTRAAAAGGYTDVFAMANTNPVTDTVDLVNRLRSRSAGASARVHPNSAATLGLKGEQLVDLEALLGAGVRIFSDDGRCVNDDGLVHELLQRLAGTGAVFAQHAQSESIVGGGVINARVADQIGCAGWPEAGEEAVIARDIALARATGGHLHVCHVSTRRSVDQLRWAKSVGATVTAEVCPHHLVLTDDDAVSRGPALKVNPPLRSKEDVLALRHALADGTIDIVATDHAPHPAETKNRPWATAAFGLTSIETALPIVAEVLSTTEGAVDWGRLATVMSTEPARIGGIADIAGIDLIVGSPATFCVVEEGSGWEVDSSLQHSKSRNTPFEGRRLHHRVVMTVLEGNITHATGDQAN